LKIVRPAVVRRVFTLALPARKKRRGFSAGFSVNRDVIRTLPEEALIAIYRETVRPLYGYVSRRVGGDRGLAEDLVQETWMRALDAWPAKGVPDEPLAWLQRVARNALVSHFRRCRPELVDPASIELEGERASAVDGDRAAVISWGMARLSRSHADILEAFYFDGKDVREIAQERSLSERAVEGRLRRARARLRKRIERVLRPSAASSGRPAAGGTEHARQTRTP
jgi:RNA polymerase sigma factor (sigma-70 family)